MASRLSSIPSPGLVGMGKSSKNKPTVLIEKAKDLHKLLLSLKFNVRSE